MSGFLDIVVAEDDKVLSDLLCEEIRLQRNGFIIGTHPRSTLKATIDFLVEYPAHAVLLDLRLEDSRGIETIYTVRQYTDAPIIVLSGTTDNKEKAALENMGYSVFIKPEGREAAVEAVVQASKHFWVKEIKRDPIMQILNNMKTEIEVLHAEFSK
jgi:DNA-binding response OmpR family regulator